MAAWRGLALTEIGYRQAELVLGGGWFQRKPVEKLKPSHVVHDLELADFALALLPKRKEEYQPKVKGKAVGAPIAIEVPYLPKRWRWYHASVFRRLTVLEGTKDAYGRFTEKPEIALAYDPDPILETDTYNCTRYFIEWDRGTEPVAPLPSAVATSLRSVLTKVTDSNARAFIEEAVACYEARLYRAAVVLSWVGAVALLHKQVVDKHLAVFNAEAQRRDAKWRPAKNSDGLGRMKEHEFLDVIESLGVIGKNVKEELQNCLKLRNACGGRESRGEREQVRFRTDRAPATSRSPGCRQVTGAFAPLASWSERRGNLNRLICPPSGGGAPGTPSSSSRYPTSGTRTSRTNATGLLPEPVVIVSGTSRTR